MILYLFSLIVKMGTRKVAFFYLPEKIRPTTTFLFQTIVNMPTTYKASLILP